MRKRKIVKVGGSYDIRLESADIKDFGWEEGTIVDIEDIIEVKEE